MIKEIVGATMAVAIGVITLWLIIPMLNTTKIAVFANLPDQDNATNMQLMGLADNVFYGLIFMVILITGFIVVQYMARKDTIGVG